MAQSNVDNLTERLQRLSTTQVTNWKYFEPFRVTGPTVEEMSGVQFDDSRWRELRLGQHINRDSCWFRTVLTVPETIMQQPVSNTLRLNLAVDDAGDLWINGDHKGRFAWEGQFLLDDNIKPGAKITILVKMINTGGPGRLLNAELQLPALDDVRQIIQNLSFSLRVAQKIFGFDTYQTNARVRYDPGVDRSKRDPEKKQRLYERVQALAQQVDVQSLENGDMESFKASVEKVRQHFPELDREVKRYTLFFTANAHIDAAWLWRERETHEVCKNTFSSVLDMMERFPGFTYTQSAACYYHWMQTMYPDVYDGIKSRIADGRWEIIGGSWIEPDCNMISGVSWMHQLLFGQNYFKNHFSNETNIGWNPDSFGYNWNMPQFYRNAGIDVFITQKIGWNDTNVFPHRIFWWEGPDGSRILSYFPFDYINRVDDPFQLVDWLRQFEANTGFTKLLILFGVGDHGGGPTPEMLAKIERMKCYDIYPSIQYGTTAAYLNWLKAEGLNDMPVWKDELYLEYHRGTLTTQAKMKEYNRRCEVLLSDVQKLASFNQWLDGAYPAADLQEAWRLVLLNQFHDILPGSSIREVHVDALKSYKEAEEIGLYRRQEMLDAIADRINTETIKADRLAVVFNTLNWERSETVALKPDKGDQQDYAVFTIDGKAVPSQTVQTDRYQRAILFRAEKIPAMGYRVFLLRRQEAPRFQTDVQIDNNALENCCFRVEVDSESGWVNRIYDKRLGREILTDVGNKLQLFEDRPDAWDAWNIGLGRQYRTNFRKLEIVERGPLRVVLRAYHDFLNPNVVKSYPTEDFPESFFEQDIILYSESKRIDFKLHADWWEDHTMLKVAFPVNVQSDKATYEIPYAAIQRTTNAEKQEDKGKWEVGALRWADLSQKAYGVSLLNNSKYGYDIKSNVMRLSLLRSPKWPDETTDRGTHTIEYALYPHKGDWKDGGTVQAGHQFNQPLMVTSTGQHKGVLPPVYSFIQLKPESQVLTVVKRQQDDPDKWIVQWYNSTDRDTEATLVFPTQPKGVWHSNFLEETLQSMEVDGKEMHVQNGAFKITTIKVAF